MACDSTRDPSGATMGAIVPARFRSAGGRLWIPRCVCGIQGRASCRGEFSRDALAGVEDVMNGRPLVGSGSSHTSRRSGRGRAAGVCSHVVLARRGISTVLVIGSATGADALAIVVSEGDPIVCHRCVSCASVGGLYVRRASVLRARARLRGAAAGSRHAQREDCAHDPDARDRFEQSNVEGPGAHRARYASRVPSVAPQS